jgi:hypothetical protein
MTEYINKLTIIETGDYITRDGRRVTIHKTDGVGSFPVKGSVWRMFRGKMRPRGYEIWMINGSYRPLGHHGLDIVAKWEEVQP